MPKINIYKKDGNKIDIKYDILSFLYILNFNYSEDIKHC